MAANCQPQRQPINVGISTISGSTCDGSPFVADMWGKAYRNPAMVNLILVSRLVEDLSVANDRTLELIRQHRCS